jgi:hypothetical protein
MNLQEQIKRILKEETNSMNMILRRLPADKLEKMDDEFNSSLNYMSGVFLKNYKADPDELPLTQFTRMVIVDLVTLLELRRYLPNDVELYEDVIKKLSIRYKKRITSRYKVLKKY